MKPCRRACRRAACRIEGPSSKHLEIPGLRFRNTEAWRNGREKQECEVRMYSERQTWTPKLVHHEPLLVW